VNLEAVSDWLGRARTLVQAGDIAGARALLADAMRAYPTEPMLANAAGDLAIKVGDIELAERHFAAARKHGPANIEYALNHAIALQKLGRPVDAVAALTTIEASGRGLPKYCGVRASCHRDAGQLEEAARWFDAAVAANPQYALALHGRARVALERGERSALAHIDAALAVKPGEADLWLARAQALDVVGETVSAREIAEQLVEQAPHWLEGLRFLAQLRHAAGEANWASHYAAAAQSLPQLPQIPLDHIALLAGLDLAVEATEVAARARSSFPGVEQFALLEAVNAGFAGDDARAEQIFASLAMAGADRWTQEARHRIRQGDTDRALAAVDKALVERPWDIAAWAMRGLAWRLASDDRATWLHEQDGLVALMPLVDAEAVLGPAVERLHELHDHSPMPLGQSLRGGTQTRGNLFDRTEPELARLQQAILQTVDTYRAQLPPQDDAHPLLRHRDAPLHILGSWSVRLHGGGDHHTAHIHPQGILSSACYLILPQGRAPGDGALEIGRPAPDLRLSLGPLRVIEPQVGHLALFPSTLYHGTTPFGAGQRMTVAFDVITGE
jgi:tetratricopeptide (TPR) repeat protein